MPRALSWRHRLYANSRAFISRFLALACNPKCFAPLLVDFWLLLQSTWSERQLGPDVVYPILSIRKHHSGRLARLILEHCRASHWYEVRVGTLFPRGIDPPCVAVIDLDEVPRDVVENGYSTQGDLYGLTSMLMLLATIFTLSTHALYVRYLGFIAHSVNFIFGIIVNMLFCLHAIWCGDGVLTLSRKSDMSTPGCAVLLDQDFTVVLNGNQSVVEAIAEGSFDLSHPSRVGIFPRLEEERRALFFNILELVCEGIYLAILMLLLLLFPRLGRAVAMVWMIIAFITALRRNPVIDAVLDNCLRFYLPMSMLFPGDILLALVWAEVVLLALFMLFVGYKTRNYPIRPEKFLEALGHPRVKKWQFDTLAAAATFKCLAICRGIPRPIRSIEVLAFLDMLIPDQRDVWKAWKERVADRIVHEVNISFTPTIPTFGDERQQHLKDLLDQAQSGNDTYRRFYDVPGLAGHS